MNLRLILILSLILIPIVNAGVGKTFELDFDLRENYEMGLEKSDRILFEYGGYNHTIIVDEIRSDVVEADIFLFLEAGLHNPHYAYLKKEYDLRLDFDREGGKELEISLIRIDKEKGKATLAFKRLEAWDENAKIEPFFRKRSSDNGGERDFSSYIIGGIIVAFVVILSLIKFLMKKNKGIYF